MDVLCFGAALVVAPAPALWRVLQPAFARAPNPASPLSPAGLSLLLSPGSVERRTGARFCTIPRLPCSLALCVCFLSSLSTRSTIEVARFRYFVSERRGPLTPYRRNAHLDFEKNVL